MNKILCIGVTFTTVLLVLSIAEEQVEETSPILTDMEEMIDFYKRDWQKVGINMNLKLLSFSH